MDKHVKKHHSLSVITNYLLLPFRKISAFHHILQSIQKNGTKGTQMKTTTIQKGNGKRLQPFDNRYLNVRDSLAQD